MTIPEPHLVTLTAAQEFLQCPVSRNSMWRWITHGVVVDGETVKLRATRQGGRWYTSAVWVDTFLAAWNGEPSDVH